MSWHEYLVMRSEEANEGRAQKITGALNLQDRKMKDKEISGGGKCRTGK